MGSGISSLPEKLNENDLIRICNIHYEKNMFNSLKDPLDGLINKDFFLGNLFIHFFSFISSLIN